MTLKLCVAQLNFIVGDLEGNAQKIITAAKDAYANPASYGFVNNTVPICDADKIKLITGGAVTDGSSLFCNGTPGMPYNGVRTGADATTWAFADGVHPSLGGHQVISNFMVQQLKAAGWI